MRILTLSFAAYGAAVALSFTPWSPSHAQAETANPAAAAPIPAVAHGDWTLRQREDWHEENSIRDGAHGQLTDNQNSDLEGRLDAMAARIHWANMTTYAQPW
jgi:hypothetical protein